MQLASADITGCERRFDDFFSNCTAMYGSHGCKVDIMAVHYYGCSTTDMQRCEDPESMGAELVLTVRAHLILLRCMHCLYVLCISTYLCISLCGVLQASGR